MYRLKEWKEGGVGDLRVLELLPGFWSCSQGFGVASRILELLPRFSSKRRKFILMKSSIKREL